MGSPKFSAVHSDPLKQCKPASKEYDKMKNRQKATEWCSAACSTQIKINASSGGVKHERSHATSSTVVSSRLRTTTHRFVDIGCTSWHYQQKLRNSSKLACYSDNSVPTMLSIPQMKRYTGHIGSAERSRQLPDHKKSNYILPDCKRKRVAAPQGIHDGQNVLKVSPHTTTLVNTSCKPIGPKSTKPPGMETKPLVKFNLIDSKKRKRCNAALSTFAFSDKKGVAVSQAAELASNAKIAKTIGGKDHSVWQTQHSKDLSDPDLLFPQDSKPGLKKRVNSRDLDPTTVTLRVRAKANAQSLQELTVSEMKCFLKAVQQTTGGRKSELQLRIMKYLDLESEP